MKKKLTKPLRNEAPRLERAYQTKKIPFANSSDMENSYLFNYLLHLLARRQYSEYELTQKLHQKKATLDQTNQLLKRLRELKLLDDNTFTKNYLSSRVRHSPRSLLLLQKELHQRGIPALQVQEAWTALELDELELCRQALAKKRRHLHDTPNSRPKLIRFLNSRGFSWDIINKCLHSQINLPFF